MRTRRLRDRLALLLAAALGVAGLAAAPRDRRRRPRRVHGLKGEYYTQSAPGAFDFDELKATGFDPNLDFDNLEPRLAFSHRQVGRRQRPLDRQDRPGEDRPPHLLDHRRQRLPPLGRRQARHRPLGRRLGQANRPPQPVELTAGTAYDIKVEYFEHYGGSNLHLRWTPPGGTKKAVPQSAFRLPDGFDYDGAIAATVLGDGRTLKLDFAQPLAAPPAGLTDHLEAVIGGAKWPLGTVTTGPRRPAQPARRRSRNPSSATRPAPPRHRRHPLRRQGRPHRRRRQRCQRLLEQRPQPLRRTSCAPSGPTRSARTTPTPSTRARS